MGSFLYTVIHGLVTLLIFAIIVSAVLSWLVAFNVINSRNQFVYSILRGLDAVTGWVLAPFRRIIPPLGGVDITPILAILVLGAFNEHLLPWLFGLLPAGLG
jgi:YggT family protein